MDGMFMFIINVNTLCILYIISYLGGGFKYLLFSSLFGEMIQID